MFIKRTATWLLAWGAVASLAPIALAQVPANSNLNYSNPNPSWENASAPFAESAPQSHGLIVPHSLGFEPKWDWFAPAETSSYGNGPRAKIGAWGSYERVFWSMSSPSAAAIGSTTATGPILFVPESEVIPPFLVPRSDVFPNGPTVDNRFIAAVGSWGNRWELGYTDTDNRGLMVSVLDHVSQANYTVVNNPAIALDDPAGLLLAFGNFTFTPVQGNPASEFTVSLPIVEMPTAFDVITMKNVLTLNGVELMATYRAPRLHKGGYFQLLYGARWLQISDAFIFEGFGNGFFIQSATATYPSPLIGFNSASATVSFPINVLAHTLFSTRAINNLVGPQIGGRWEVQRGRWVTSLEARFLAAANFQNLSQKTLLGDLARFTLSNVSAITDFRGLGSQTHQYTTTFSPVGELRVQTSYQATSNVALKVGYTGLVVGNISRASNRIDYSGVNLISILPTNFNQTFWSNGLNFGVEINR
jgi:hypothetical protein